MTPTMPQQPIAADAGVGRYPHAFRPLQLGPAALRNRIFVPAHTTNYGEDNLPTDRHLAYHRARAAGGAAMIVFEGIRVHRSSLGRRQGVNGYEHRLHSTLRDHRARRAGRGCETVRPDHPSGPPHRRQLCPHGGLVLQRRALVRTGPPPHPMTQGEIAEVVAAHAQVARHLVAAGLDGLEVTLAHGHLLQQFLSPAVNRRRRCVWRFAGEPAAHGAGDGTARCAMPWDTASPSACASPPMSS